MPADRSPLQLLHDPAVRGRLGADAGLLPPDELHRRGDRHRRQRRGSAAVAAALVLVLGVAGAYALVPQLRDGTDRLATAGQPPSSTSPEGALLPPEALGREWSAVEPAAFGAYACGGLEALSADAARAYAGSSPTDAALHVVGTSGPAPRLDLDRVFACHDATATTSGGAEGVLAPLTVDGSGGETARWYTADVGGEDPHRALAVVSDAGSTWSLLVLHRRPGTQVAEPGSLAVAVSQALCGLPGACPPADAGPPPDLPRGEPFPGELPPPPDGPPPPPDGPPSGVAPPLVDLTAVAPGWSSSGAVGPPVGEVAEAATCGPFGYSGTGQGWTSADGHVAQQDVFVFADEASARRVAERLAGGDACPDSPLPLRDLSDRLDLPAQVTVAGTDPSCRPETSESGEGRDTCVSSPTDVQVVTARRGRVVSALATDVPWGPTVLRDVAHQLATAVCAEPEAGC